MISPWYASAWRYPVMQVWQLTNPEVLWPIIEPRTHVCLTSNSRIGKEAVDWFLHLFGIAQHHLITFFPININEQFSLVMSVSVCDCGWMSPSIRPSVRPSVHPSISPSIRPSVHLSLFETLFIPAVKYDDDNIVTTISQFYKVLGSLISVLQYQGKTRKRIHRQLYTKNGHECITN